MIRQTEGTLNSPTHGAVWGAYDGVMYGDYSGNIVMSSDGWATIKRLVDIGERIGCVYITTNGTLIVGTRSDQGSVYRITPDGKMDLVLMHKRGIYARGWSINGHGSRVVIGAYGTKSATNTEDNGREVYLSVDDGQTFNLIFETPALQGTHVHAVAVDAVTNDVWVSNGDSPTSSLRLLKYPNWESELIANYQPTAIIAKHSRYVLFGTDFCVPTNGVFRYDRDTKNMEKVFTFPEEHNLPVYSAYYDKETQVVYFGTAQTMGRSGHEWESASIWKSEPPYDNWEMIKVDKGYEFSVHKALVGISNKLYFAKDGGSLSLPNIKTHKHFLSEPLRK